jgi:hypothetical protein
MLNQSTSQASYGTPAAADIDSPNASPSTPLHGGQGRSNDASIGQSAEQAVQSVGALYTALNEVALRQVQANPYATLGAAAAVGFVLGGGLASPIGRVLLRLSVKTFGPPIISAVMNGAVERVASATQNG